MGVMFLAAFYSFFFSFIFYLLLLKVIPFPDFASWLPDLLPYYKPFLTSHWRNLLAYFLGVFLIPFATIVSLSPLSRLTKVLESKFPWFIKILSLVTIVISLSTLLLIFQRDYFYFGIYKEVLSLDMFVFTPLFLTPFFSGSILLIIFLFLPVRTKFETILKKIKKLNPLFTLFAIVLIILTLSDRVMDEKNLFVARPRQYSHTAVFVDPVYDILQGKVVLVNTDSPYGILISYLPAFFFKLFAPLSFTNFFSLLILFGIVYYLCFFLLVSTRFKNPIIALTALITAFSFHFYLDVDRYVRPMLFPLRYLLDMPFFLILMIPKGQKWKNIVLPFYLGFAVLYNFETGLPLVFAYLTYVFFSSFALFSLSAFFQAVNSLAKSLLSVSLALVFLTLAYSLYAKYQTGFFPDWSRALFYVRIFGHGMDRQIFFRLYYLPLAIYLTTIIKNFLFLRQKKQDKNLAFETSLAVYGILLLANFIVRGYIVNLAAVSLPAIIIGISLFRDLLRQIFPKEGKAVGEINNYPLFGLYLTLGILIIFGFVYYPYRLGINSRYEYWPGDKEPSRIFYEKALLSTRLFEKYLPGEKRVIIMSYVDTLLEMSAGKINILPFGTSQNVMTDSQENRVLAAVQNYDQKYLFAETEWFTPFVVYRKVYDFITNNYHVIDHLGILDVWERNK